MNKLSSELLDLACQKNLYDYLAKTGWRRIDVLKHNVTVFRRPEDSLMEVIVPHDRTADVYKLALEPILLIIAKFERISVQELVDKL